MSCQTALLVWPGGCLGIQLPAESLHTLGRQNDTTHREASSSCGFFIFSSLMLLGERKSNFRFHTRTCSDRHGCLSHGHLRLKVFALSCRLQFKTTQFRLLMAGKFSSIVPAPAGYADHADHADHASPPKIPPKFEPILPLTSLAVTGGRGKV